MTQTSTSSEPAAPGRVWQAFHVEGLAPAGWLVTAAGDVDQPIAFVPKGGGPGNPLHDRPDAELLAAAESVAWNPAAAPRGVVDLREYGRDDSPRPTPDFLYRLALAPPLAGPAFATVRPFPF